MLRTELADQGIDQRCQTGSPPCSILWAMSFKFYCYIKHDRVTFANAITQ